MKTLVCYFTYQRAMYEIFADDDGGIIYQKHGGPVVESDKELISHVVENIKKRKYVKTAEITYHEEPYIMYLNMFNDQVYFAKKNEDGTETACAYEEYRELYDKYNQVRVNYPGNEHDMIQKGGKLPKNKDRKTSKTFKMVIAGVVLTVTVMISGVSCAKFYVPPTDQLTNQEIPAITESVLEEVQAETGIDTGEVNVEMPLESIHEENVSDTSPEAIDEMQRHNAIIQSILESLKDEEPWVQRQVVEQYKEENNIPIDTKETIQDETTSEHTQGTQMIIDAIQSNDNLTQEDKDLLIDSSVAYWDSITKLNIDVEQIASQYHELKIEEYYYDSFQESMMGPNAQYDREANTITLYSSKDNPFNLMGGDDETKISIDTTSKNARKTHETRHLEGYFPGFPGFSEGYAEQTNPNRAPMIYSKEQVMVVMLEEVFGLSTMQEAYHNESMIDLYNSLYEKIPDHAQVIWATLYDCEDLLEKWMGFSPNNLWQNLTYQRDANEVLEKIKNAYNLLHEGKNAEENKVLNLCSQMLLTGKYEEYDLRDVYRDPIIGDVYYSIGKDVSYTYPVDYDDPQETRTTSVSGTFDVKGERE